MKKKPYTAAAGRRRAGNLQQGSHENPLLAPAIPGVRVAYIGQSTAAVEYIRSYWHARRAAFRQLTLADDPSASGLERLLEWADIVLHSEDGIAESLRRRIEAFCDRSEKPLIGVDQYRLFGLADTLVSWCPLRSFHS